MLTLEYTLRFLSPAFLGNADQQGQWRTPPIKALLRQWWRVAYAADHGHRVEVGEMRKAEGELFGVAADGDGESRKSRVRIRLGSWDIGTMKTWTPLEKVVHPEVDRDNGKVGSDLYLAYGPLTFGRGSPQLKSGAAIQEGEHSVLLLGLTETNRLPKGEAARIARALQFLNLYGTLGGRSRNAWGSFELRPAASNAAIDPATGATHLRNWKEAIGLDWPHAIGQDSAPLIWQSAPMPDWRAAMQFLAQLKIDVRQLFIFPPNERPPHRQPLERHWLAYPVTNHRTLAWEDKFRLPNSLRFKLRRDPADDSKLRAIVFHVPCKPPPEFKPDLQAITRVWTKVHAFLDSRSADLTRIPA